jgi:hypothetical protein
MMAERRPGAVAQRGIAMHYTPMALIIGALGLIVTTGTARAEWCGTPIRQPVGNLNQLTNTSGPIAGLIVDSVPVGTTMVTISQQPRTTGPHVVYSGPIASGQRLNIRLQNFWIMFNGTGGNALVRLCMP